MKSLNYLSSLLLLLAVTATDAATIAPFGPALESDIVSAFIPPTRSDDPYLTTVDSVFRWDKETEEWRKVYTLPWSSARILAIAGYRKSSKPIYVAHSGGVARSSDAGESWAESAPSGFAAAADEFIAILVNPAERQHAILLTASAAWETTDYGATWTKFHAADPGDPIVGGGFLVEAEEAATGLLLASRSSLFHYREIPLGRFTVWSAPYPLHGLLTHPKDAVAFLRMSADRWTILQRPFTGDLISSEPSTVSGSYFAPNRAGSSSLWIAAEGQLSVASLIAGSVSSVPVVGLPGPEGEVLPHPDEQDAVYIYEGPQLYLIQDAFTEPPPDFILPAPQPDDRDALSWPLHAVAPDEIARDIPGGRGSKEQTEKALQEIMAKQPPFSLVAGKAIRFAFGRPVDFAEWQRQARRRHWLPELRLEGGVRERNTDNHMIVESVDEFGFPGEAEDFNLPDDVRSLRYAAVVLEWDLYDLLFDDEQINVHRERRYTHEQRRELIQELSRLYHRRIERIAEKEGLFGEPSPQQHLRLVLEINELTEIINGFCGEEVIQ